MPIKPENKKLYPKNWKEISKRIRFDRAKGLCEKCGVENYAIGYRDEEGKFVETEGMEIDAAVEDGYKIIKIVLTVAHLDHDPTNNKEENLKALCQKCHNSMDAKNRARNRTKTTRRKHSE